MTGNEEAGRQEQHKAFAVECFNLVWGLLDKADRTAEDDERMVHAAHASRFHWGEIGTPLEFARGEWQISRVYAVLGRSEAALHHAQRSLDLCEATASATLTWPSPTRRWPEGMPWPGILKSATRTSGWPGLPRTRSRKRATKSTF